MIRTIVAESKCNHIVENYPYEGLDHMELFVLVMLWLVVVETWGIELEN